jgi:uncharacterized protein (DUF111 family)
LIFFTGNPYLRHGKYPFPVPASTNIQKRLSNHFNADMSFRDWPQFTIRSRS